MAFGGPCHAFKFVHLLACFSGTLCRQSAWPGRILQRPYKADPVLHDVMNNSILASDSIVQKIWNSHVFTAWFERHRKEMEATHGKVKNLRAAKHRFESFSKPLGRVILWLPALLATAHDIAVQREGAPEGQVAI